MTRDQKVEYATETFQALSFACGLVHAEAHRYMDKATALEEEGGGEEAEAAREDEKYCRVKLLRLVALRNEAEAEGNRLLYAREG
jgi:hypothetical protein